MARLAVYLENTARLRKKVKSAIMYPTVVTVVAIVITIFLLVKVVPVFRAGICQLQCNPARADARILIKISNFVKHYLLGFLLLWRGGRYGWFYFIKTPAGRQFWDSRRIRLPIFGVIAHKICLARFSRTLASLIRSGVPILEVLQIVSADRGQRRHGEGRQDRRAGH